LLSSEVQHNLHRTQALCQAFTAARRRHPDSVLSVCLTSARSQATDFPVVPRVSLSLPTHHTHLPRPWRRLLHIRRYGRSRYMELSVQTRELDSSWTTCCSYLAPRFVRSRHQHADISPSSPSCAASRSCPLNPHGLSRTSPPQCDSIG